MFFGGVMPIPHEVYQQAKGCLSPRLQALYDDRENMEKAVDCCIRFCCCVFTFGLSTYLKIEFAQKKLENALIKIASSHSRLNLMDSNTAYDGLCDNILSFEDFAECPENTLSIIIRPEIYHPIKVITSRIENQRKEIDNQIYVLSRKIDEQEEGKDYNHHRLFNPTRHLFEEEKRTLEAELKTLKTPMEKLRKARYDQKELLRILENSPAHYFEFDAHIHLRF